jgi:hypothetical protein
MKQWTDTMTAIIMIDTMTEDIESMMTETIDMMATDHPLLQLTQIIATENVLSAVMIDTIDPILVAIMMITIIMDALLMIILTMIGLFSITHT